MSLQVSGASNLVPPCDASAKQNIRQGPAEKFHRFSHLEMFLQTEKDRQIFRFPCITLLQGSSFTATYATAKVQHNR
jgi:hypothetical protein